MHILIATFQHHSDVIVLAMTGPGPSGDINYISSMYPPSLTNNCSCYIIYVRNTNLVVVDVVEVAVDVVVPSVGVEVVVVLTV